MEAVGEADVLKLRKLPNPEAGPGQIVVDIAASGVNFMDIGIRRGMNSVPLPHVLGVEGSGRVVAVADDVSTIAVGQRVAWVYALGSYADRIVMPASSAVPIPDAVDEFLAASLMMQGLTASHFATDFYPVQPGDVALVHAAAGGLGQILSQIIKLRGGTVIGRVSSLSKVAAATKAGADEVIVDAGDNFAEQVLRLTNGRGVDVVYDGSGPATWAGSLDSLKRSGTLCWYGPVLGGPSKLHIMDLPRSIKIGYAVFFDHIHTPELLRSRATQLFEWVREGKIRIAPPTTFPLAEAGLAHSAMERRQTMGKLLLIP
jgi:NADPH2:quinone reductase